MHVDSTLSECQTTCKLLVKIYPNSINLQLFISATLGMALLLLGGLPGSLYAQGLQLGGEKQPAGQDLNLGAQQTAPQPAGQSTAAAVSRTTYGDWEVACLAQGAECAMAQIGNDSTGTPVLEIVIRKLEEPLDVEGETAIAVLDVITPLGVVLTAGLSMKIDDGKPQSAPFQICTDQGCLVREPVAEELISRLRRGAVAEVRVVAASQGDVASNISLKGFTKAFSALP